MPQIINTNIASLNAQRNLNASQRSGDTSLQRLSSGLRINSAKDDAAGLAISTRFDAQIRGTNVAVRNAGDAISLAQTAEGALSSMKDSLQRIRELSLQSANDTNSTIDREALQEEVGQLISEIENIAATTNFNGKKLLDGSFQNSVFQTGANLGNTISVTISKLDTSTLGTADTSGISSRTTTTALVVGSTGNEMVAGDIVINGISVGASVGTDDTASTSHAASSAIAKAAAINDVSDQTGVTATVDANYVAGTTTADATAANVSLNLNGVSINLSKGTTLTVEQNLQATADAINEKSGATGVRAVFDGDTAKGISLVADDGRNIVLTETTSNTLATFGLAAASSLGNAYVGTYSLSSDDGSDIALTTTTGNIDNAGFEVGSFSGNNAGIVSDNGTTTALVTGDIVINNVGIGPSLSTDDTASTANADGSAIAKAAAINRSSDQTGVTALANENRVNSGNLTTTTASATITVNGVSITASFSTTDDVAVKQAAIIDAINQKSGQTGVTAEVLDSDSFTLVAADGRNIDISGATAMASITTTTFVSSVTLLSGGQIDVESNTNSAGLAKAGLRIGTFGGAESGSLLQDVDISTVAGAEAALKAVDNALQTVTSKQAELGAIQNRFQNTIANLEVNNENLNSANSRIRDADFASETAALSRAQVLQQAGISILAQANARPQQVLSLLQ
ncbi:MULTISPECIES: flagellin [unclassified Hahella]|uniref:flagellin N-terminal helical domain-containing protein n=1 Tax=unclassified Hahella TaxID=2624107 RepID=UPI001C1EFF43|nr:MULTISPECIES: flagellin [unclassified Hahella]MBU6953019.1 flagellin [Hahella sp. HN01]MDG9668659.1 flagellin [Hahella sp. CR1]